MKRIIWGITVLFTLVLVLSGCSDELEDQIHETAKLSSTVQQDHIATSSSAEKITGTKKSIVIWDGCLIQEAKYTDIFDYSLGAINGKLGTLAQIKNYYEREYNIYANGVLLGKDKGKIVSGDYENESRLALEKYQDQNSIVAISDTYNAVPRVKKVSISNLPKEFGVSDYGKSALEEINKRYNVSVTIKQIIEIDLDGDNKKEYLLTVNDKNKIFSAYVLFNSDKKIVAYPSVIKDGKYMDFITILDKFNGEFIDVDNDNVMEILTYHTAYAEGDYRSLSKYNNGEYRIYNYQKNQYERELEHNDYVTP